MKGIFPLIIVILLLSSSNSNAMLLSGKIAPYEENTADSTKKKCTLFNAKFPRKGKFFVYWGYNISSYSKSNIRFTGRDYDFTIYDVKGTDNPTKEFMTYINPKLLTVPQNNWKIGYNLSDKHSISFGNDHMKYVMPEQKVKMTGTISSGENAGIYDKQVVLVGELSEEHDVGNTHGGQERDTLLSSGFASKLEHCDGLNDVSFEYGYTGNLWASKNGKHSIAIQPTLSIGGVITDTEAIVLGAKDPSHGDEAHTTEGLHPEHNASRKSKGYHLAGFSTSVGLGVQVNFFEDLFLLARVKGGYINMSDIITTHEGGRAQQSFGYIEPMLLIGYSFFLKKK